MTIDNFKGEYRWLSNFHLCEIEWQGDTYRSVEHAYQAAKTSDPEERRKIREAATCGKAKRLGQKVTLDPVWAARERSCKLATMRGLLWRKFQNPLLREKLIQTGRHHLIEGNDWGDTWWGVCNGNGLNHLGRILMDIREEILREMQGNY
ncbi:MAG: NADAR family protein [Nitrospira sp.]